MRDLDLLCGFSTLAFSFFSLFAYAAYELRWFRKPLDLKDKYKLRANTFRKIDGAKKIRELGVEATNLSAFVLGEISGQGGANLETEKLLEKAPPSVRREDGKVISKNV